MKTLERSDEPCIQAIFSAAIIILEVSSIKFTHFFSVRELLTQVDNTLKYIN